MTHVSSSLLSSLWMGTEAQAAWGRKHDWVQGKHSYFVTIVRRWLRDSRGADGQLPLHTSITYNLSFPKAAPSRGSPMSPTSALCLTRSEKSQMCSMRGSQNHSYFPPWVAAGVCSSCFLPQPPAPAEVRKVLRQKPSSRSWGLNPAHPGAVEVLGLKEPPPSTLLAELGARRLLASRSSWAPASQMSTIPTGPEKKINKN